MKLTTILLLFLPILLVLTAISAETAAAQSDPDPRGAFFRSLALPGWGLHYAGEENRNRALMHAGTELALVLSVYGLHQRSGTLEQRYQTLASLRAGTELSGRDRTFLIAVGDFDSLSDYNTHQLRSRNWDRIFDDTPENRWEWSSRGDRERFRELRSGRDTIRNNIPALFGMMVVNRVVSAISAYNRSGRVSDTTVVFVPVPGSDGPSGVTASIQHRF